MCVRSFNWNSIPSKLVQRFLGPFSCGRAWPSVLTVIVTAQFVRAGQKQGKEGGKRFWKMRLMGRNCDSPPHPPSAGTVTVVLQCFPSSSTFLSVTSPFYTWCVTHKKKFLLNIVKNVFGKQTRRDDSKKLNLLNKFAKWGKDVEKRQRLGGRSYDFENNPEMLFLFPAGSSCGSETICLVPQLCRAC